MKDPICRWSANGHSCTRFSWSSTLKARDRRGWGFLFVPEIRRRVFVRYEYDRKGGVVGAGKDGIGGGGEMFTSVY